MNSLLFDIQDLSFAYRNNTVLQGIDLQLEKGKFYGLIGANGSGKSTLLELLMATLSPGPDPSNTKRET